MRDEEFHNALSSGFWAKCKLGMPAPYQEIMHEILLTLDAAGGTSSVRSRYQSRGGYELQGRVSLLEHSINVAMISGDLAGDGIIQNLAVIAGLGHDCGKLGHLHPGRYAAAMHAHWSAEYVQRVIGGKLIDVQAAAIISAVRYHHVAGDGPIHRVLREADKLAREREMLATLTKTAKGRLGDGR